MQAIRSATALVVAPLQILLLTALANGQETTRVSVDSSGAQGNLGSNLPSVSADGQVVAFVSSASNLVAGDTNGRADIFVHDRSTGITERVSVSSSGVEGNDDCDQPSISADGQIVAFVTRASNLVAGDTNASLDVFVHDRSTGTTERVSVDSSGAEGDSDSYFSSISADGQVVAFLSNATNLVAGDTNNYTDVFVHDRSTGITERVSVSTAGVQGNKWSLNPVISANGQVVAFGSFASNLVAGDTNLSRDVFVHDRSTGITERVSVDSSGVQGNSVSAQPSISADGQFVAFQSFSTNLVAGDANNFIDIFVRDRSAGTTERVSVDSSGAESDSDSEWASISSDGRFVAFSSFAANLVAGDTNGKDDIFVHDRTTGTTERVSVDSSGAEGNSDSDAPSISADGRIVTFESVATNLVAGDTNGAYDAFVHERCIASWTNYGAGFPGTNGVPSFTSQADPVLGTTLTLDLADSYGSATTGLLFIGLQRTSIHASWGGDLLVAPLITMLVGLPAAGASFTGDLPADDNLCGVTIDLQVLEGDPGAAKGVSFTQGLELVLGH